MRIWVVGTSGSGKTTFAREAARHLDIPHVEMDAINFTPNWADLNNNDRPEFLRRVGEATSGGSWVCDGNYHMQDLLLDRTDHLAWLDYSRSRVLYQVFRRSLARAIDGKEVWPGCREGWRDWLRPDHPIRWAWSTHGKNRARYAEMFKRAHDSDITHWQLSGPVAAARCLKTLKAAQAAQQGA